MTIRLVAQIIEEIYYSGRVKTDRKLNKADFIQYGKTAFANLLRLHYFNLNAVEYGAGLDYISNLLQPKTFKVPDQKWRGARVLDLSGAPMIPLPKNAHLFAVMAVGCGGMEVSVDFVSDVEAEHYKSADFADFPFAVIRGRRIELYHLPPCVSEVEIEGVWDNDTAEVPPDLAFDVINQVLGMTLKVAGFPVDKVDDNNPNVTTVKQRLADTEGVA